MRKIAKIKKNQIKMIDLIDNKENLDRRKILFSDEFLPKNNKK